MLQLCQRRLRDHAGQFRLWAAKWLPTFQISHFKKKTIFFFCAAIAGRCYLGPIDTRWIWSSPNHNQALPVDVGPGQW